jgi:heat shock protein HslJ
MRTVLASAAAAIALWACAPPAAEQSELAGRWDVQQIAGASLGEGVELWIEIDDDGETVRGFSGCNAFTTTITSFGTSVAFSPVVEEPGACASEAAATDEARFLGVLPSVQRYILRGRSLELLQAPSGSETLIRLRRMDETGG